MNKTTLKQGLMVIVGLIIIGAAFWYNTKPSEDATTIRLGIINQPFAALAKVAIDEGFFKQEGLNVKVNEFTAGKFALPALLGGSLDLITVGELPVTLATLNGEKLSIVGEISNDSFPMVLRKEGQTVFDPQTYFSTKRKIATSVGGGPEFFAAEFFKKYNIKPSQYEVINMAPPDMPTALANGNVDGIAIFEPYTSFALQKVGADNVFILADSSLYSESAVIVGRSDFVAKNEQTIEKFLSALSKSENFIKQNKNQSIGIMSAFTKLDVATLTSIWPLMSLHLDLSQRLVSTMNNEAQWAKEIGKIKPETVIPNFLDIVSSTALKNVSPSSVQI
ncbi:MAG: ABC transporter substrate-binding protein [Candidatus Paceibacterota bacterium]|jgi:NitT/TauT family transport system substrate-binding protein